MNQRPRLLLVLPHLGGGGAERVFSLLAGGLAHGGCEVHLATLTPARTGAEEVPPGVTVHALESGRVRGSAWALVRLVRELRPDCALSTLFHLNLLLLLLRPLLPARTGIVVRQNDAIDTTVGAARKHGIPAWATRRLYRHLYPRADLVVCQSAAMAEDMEQAAPDACGRLAVLPNLLHAERIRTAAPPETNPWSGPGPHLLALGRLKPEKGFDLLVEAVARLRSGWPEARLTIAGEGPERARLEEQVRRLGLEECVPLLPAAQEPWRLFAGASAFVLSSRKDPFPNVVLEAGAAGLPIVATPASAGLEALLRGQTGVWLADEASVEGLAAALEQALRAIRPGERFAHSFVEPYTLERALPLWEEKLAEVLDRGRG